MSNLDRASCNVLLNTSVERPSLNWKWIKRGSYRSMNRCSVSVSSTLFNTDFTAASMVRSLLSIVLIFLICSSMSYNRWLSALRELITLSNCSYCILMMSCFKVAKFTLNFSEKLRQLSIREFCCTKRSFTSSLVFEINCSHIRRVSESANSLSFYFDSTTLARSKWLLASDRISSKSVPNLIISISVFYWSSEYF